MFGLKTKRKPVAKPRAKCPKAGRLVVRNLPFKITEDDVRQHFSSFGSLEDVNLLKRDDKFTGCAFVQYANKLYAANALAKSSGREFKGRTIIVDWAVSKERYEQAKKGDQEKPEVEVKQETDSDDEKPDVVELDRSLADESKESQFENESDEESEERGSEEEDDSESDEDETEEVKPKIEVPRVKSERFLELKKRHMEEDQLNLRTLFVKNVPFSASNDDFKKAAEVAGRVSYALVVMDPMTEHSRGTGFIRYEDKETADAVLSGQVKLTMRNVELQVTRARKRNEEGSNDGKKLAKDSRNLYLAKEGVILAGSPAAEGVSEGDVAKRLKLEQWKTTVLRNLHMFISPVRLIVHNIPSNYDDKMLFALFKKHSPKGSFISEARIMKTINDAEIGKSKGYGFVTFRKHEDALSALRNINNNPEIFAPNRRPIVAFSVENKKALNIKEQRRQASLKHLKTSEDGGQLENEKPKVGKRKRKVQKSEGPAKKLRPEIDTPGYAGVAAKFGNKKLMTRRQLVSQAEKHRERLKKAKTQKKLSRKQKRMKKSRSIL